jgi:hypothetical protein
VNDNPKPGSIYICKDGYRFKVIEVKSVPCGPNEFQDDVIYCAHAAWGTPLLIASVQAFKTMMDPIGR